MIPLPPNLRDIGDARLAYLFAATERDLKVEIDRVSARDARFRRALKHALLAEEEVERRHGSSG